MNERMPIRMVNSLVIEAIGGYDALLSCVGKNNRSSYWSW